jgi:Inorganic H+ pyrophosphatase
LDQAKPNYKQCVEIVARAGLKEMIKPGLLAILSPILVGISFKILGLYTGKVLLGAKVVCSFLMFATSTGILMALFFNNAGGAWDNAYLFSLFMNHRLIINNLFYFFLNFDLVRNMLKLAQQEEKEVIHIKQL